MELHDIPEAFQTKLRLAIISSLLSGKKTFKDIKQITKATDGNISGQITKLEELGYVITSKGFIGKKPCTTYEISKLGRQSFLDYVAMLERLVKENLAD